jgi:hypothetical protein
LERTVSPSTTDIEAALLDVGALLSIDLGRSAETNKAAKIPIITARENVHRNRGE